MRRTSFYELEAERDMLRVLEATKMIKTSGLKFIEQTPNPFMPKNRRTRLFEAFKFSIFQYTSLRRSFLPCQ